MNVDVGRALVAFCVLVLIGLLSVGLAAGAVGAEDTDDTDDLEVTTAVTDSALESGVSGDENVTIWLGATDGTDRNAPVEGTEIEVEIVDPDGNVHTENVTTGPDGNEYFEYDLSDRPDGEYEVRADGDFQDSFAAGPYSVVTTSTSFSSGALVGEETTFAVRVSEAGEAVDETFEIDIVNPDGDIEDTVRVEPDDAGFDTVTHTFDETGQYNLESTNGDVQLDNVNTNIDVADHLIEVNPVDQIAGEEAVIPAHVFDAEGGAADTEVTMRLFDDREWEENRTEVAEATATTTNEGLVVFEFEAPDDADRYYFEFEADDEEIPTAVFEHRIDFVEAPDDDDDFVAPGDDDPSTTLTGEFSNLDFDDFVAPGDDVKYTVELTDEDREPLEDEPVETQFTIEFQSVPVETDTITTNESGVATGTVTVPENAPDAVRLEGEAFYLDEDDSVIEAGSIGSTDIREYQIRFEEPDESVEPGSDVEIPITAIGADDVPVSVTYGIDIQKEHLFSSVETTTVTTDDDGEATLEASVPEQSSMLRVGVAGEYEPDASSTSSSGGTVGANYVNYDIDHIDPGIAVPAEAEPGDEIGIDVEEAEFETAVAVLQSPFGSDGGADATVFSADDEPTLTVPESASDGDNYDVTLLGFGEDGDRYESSTDIDVTDDPEVDVNADFDVDPTDPLTNESVVFDATASGLEDDIEEYNWSIEGIEGEGTTVDFVTEDPVLDEGLSYPDPGKYDVTLTIEDVEGDEDTTSETVDVESIRPEFDQDPEQPVVNESVTFDASETEAENDVESYHWEFVGEDGDEINITTDEPVVEIEFKDPGQYEGLFSVEDTDGNTANMGVEVFVTDEDEVLEAALEVEPDVVEAPGEATLNASASTGSIDEYQWDFTGDGEIDEVTEEPTITTEYVEAGNVTPEVTIINPEGETDTASADLVVEAEELQAALEIEPDVVEAPGEATLNANASIGSIDEYQWDFTGDGEIDAVTEEPTITTEYVDAGNVTPEVAIVNPEGETDTASADLVVEEAQEALLQTEIEAEDEQQLEDGLETEVTVENIGGAETDENVSLSVDAAGTPLGAEDEETESFEAEIGELDAGENETVDLSDELTEWAQENKVVDDLELTAEAAGEDDVDAATDDVTIDVTYVKYSAETVTADSVVEGQNITLRSFVTNEGTATSDERNATVTIENGDEAEYEFENDELDGGERDADRTQKSFSEAGDYTVELEVDNKDDDIFTDNVTDTSNFEVEEYELDLADEGEMRVPSEVRVGGNFSTAFYFETNADENVSASIDLPDEIGLRDDPEADSATEIVEADAGDNTARFDLHANQSSADDVELDVELEDTLGVDEDDNVTVNTTVPIETDRVGNTTSAVLNQDDNESSIELEVENLATQEQNVTITAQGDAEGRTLTGLEYLVRYPYGCVEQTTSSFLGALNTAQYYGYGDDEIDDDRFEDINESIGSGIERLSGEDEPDNPLDDRGQLDDGGWNFWGDQEQASETFPTVYALLGLSSVDNDPVYGGNGGEFDAELGEIDYDTAVERLEQLQGEGDPGAFDPDPDEGAFEAQSYFRDPNAMTGFTLVSLNETLDTSELDSNTSETIEEEVYVEAAEYLVDAQDEDSDAWNDEGRFGSDEASATSTALAIWGLEIALQDADFSESNVTDSDVEDAIEDGHEWLIDEQDDETGAWDNYQDSPFWNPQGDVSEEAAFAIYALSETEDTVDHNETEDAYLDAADFLTEVYEERGSWGYTRASTFAVGALQEVTGEFDTEWTITVTFADGEIEEELTIEEDNPERSVVIDDDEDLNGLREAAEDGVVDVEIEGQNGDDENGGDAEFAVVAVENDQVVEVGGE